MDWLAIQMRLKRLGHDPGPLDGIYGRRTRAAVAAFQRACGLDVRWPGTVGPKTLAALFPETEPSAPPPAVTIPWLHLAAKKRGLHETRNHSILAKFLRSDGKTLGDPRRLPWCGDFVETCIALALADEPLPTNPYLARNWLSFGDSIKPTLGAVLVFWRGKRSGISGHVGFAVGRSKSHLYVLGGNQSNAVTVAPLSKHRLLGARWPARFERPEVYLPPLSGGTVSLNEF